MKRIYFAALVGLFGCVSALSAQGRSELLLEKNWKFTILVTSVVKEKEKPEKFI